MIARKWIFLGVVVSLFAFGRGVAQTDSIPPQPPDTMKTSQPMAEGANVKRSTFTTNVLNREPVDDVDSLSTDSAKIFFFTEIVDFEGGTITHRWKFGGETVAQVAFDINGPRWRVYSTKTLMPEQTGTWTVDVVDGHGTVVKTLTFVYHDGV